MVLAPNTGRHGAADTVHGNKPGRIPSGPLDWCDFEPKGVAGLVGTFDVDWGMAVVTLYTRPIGLLADLAHFCVLVPRDQGDALARTEGFGVAKLDLVRKHGAGNMNPVVIGCPFERLARVDRAVHLFLLLTVVIGRALGVLPFHPFPLPLFLRLLFMRIRDFGVLDKVVHRVFDRAENTFVVLVSS
jgi:hypothetical protein